MSLLWPEHLTLGIFPGACWLQSPSGLVEHAANIDTRHSHLALLDAAEALLESRKVSRWRRTVVDAIVSDTIALTTALPWQEHLSSAAQVRSYARALLESQHAINGDAWTINAGFRHFKSMGLGVAVPAAMLSLLEERLAARGIRLRRVLPVSAVAYWQTHLSRKNVLAVWFMEERTRVSAMIYRGGRLQAIDAQPLLDDAIGAAERLCKRIHVLHGIVDEAVMWSLNDSGLCLESIKRCFPAATSSIIPASYWSLK